MKIIFLDFDGVMNNPGCYAREDGTKQSGMRIRCDPQAVAALNHITGKTGARIVISSTWRYSGLMFCREYLAAYGVLGSVIDLTNDLRTSAKQRVGVTRGEEIQAWLAQHQDDRYTPEAFVILDDESDMGTLYQRLVQTEGHIGLTMADADRAIAVLEAVA